MANMEGTGPILSDTGLGKKLNRLQSTISAFDSSYDHFALLSHDNRLKIWNTSSGTLKQELIEEKHLAQQYTSIAWGKGPKGKKSSGSLNETIIALGTEKGEIVLWDLLAGSVLHHLTGVHTAKVTDVVFTKKGDILYSCSEDKQIISWNVQTGAVLHKFKKDTQPLRRICLNSDDTVLAVGSSIIKLYDLSSKKVLKKLGGHANPITALQFAHKDKFIVSAASDRFLYIWDAALDSEDTNAVQALTCDSSASTLDINHSLSSSHPTVHLLGLSEAGIVNIWKFNEDSAAKSAKKKPLQPAGKASSENSDIILARFFSQNQILIARGEVSKPTFEKLEYVSSSDEIIPKITSLSAQQQKKNETVRESKKTESVAILGATDMKMADVNVPQQKLAASTTEQMSLQERLKMLELVQQQNEENNESGVKAPRVDSIHTVLVQALHTNDNTLLESVIAVRDPIIIQNTVGRLPSTFVLPFLFAVIEKFQAQPNRGIVLVAWIKELLTQHTSYLMTVPDLVHSLSGLYLTVDSRLSVFKKLLKLSGRLDLLLSQIQRSSGPKPDYSNLTLYQEEDSEEDDDEDDNEDNENDDADEDEDEDPMSEDDE